MTEPTLHVFHFAWRNNQQTCVAVTNIHDTDFFMTADVVHSEDMAANPFGAAGKSYDQLKAESEAVLNPPPPEPFRPGPPGSQPGFSGWQSIGPEGTGDIR